MSAKRNFRFLLLPLAALIGIGAYFSPSVLAPFLPDLLKRQGFKEVALTVQEIGWTRLELTDVKLDKTLTAKRLALGFGIGGIHEISASHLAIKAATDWKSLKIGPLALPFGNSSSSQQEGFPRLDLDQARFELETPAGQLSGLLASERDGNATRLRLDIAGREPTPLLAPLVLTGILSEDGDSLRFAGKINDPRHRFLLKFEGEQDRATGTGRLGFTLPRTEFAADGLQPDAVSPALRPYLGNVSGPVEGWAKLSWEKGNLLSEAQISSHGLSFESRGARLRNLVGTLALDRIWPPRTPGVQAFSVGLVSAGVPLGSGSFALAFLEDGSLYVKRAALNIADGKLRLDPVRLSPEMTGRLEFQASGIELEKLAPLFGIEGIALGGTVDGTLPVLLEKDGIRVERGMLSAREKGYLRYRPNTLPDALHDGGEAVSLMLAAMKDFRYESLALGLDGQAGGETTVAFHIKGRNPGLSDGTPFEFNFRLTGPLDRLARHAVGIVSPQESIEAALAEIKR